MSSLDSEAKPDNAGHSVLALTTSHSLVVSSPETFLPDMRKELGIIADLVESYNDELCLLKLMAVQFKTHNHQKRHCCKVSDEAAFCLIQRPYISKTLLTRRISPRGSP
ncbi:hypothetical protein [Salmonella sp. 17E42]|uniref:hypothetical protein n=1 Tax=Salmonella sp. 17E42 TaxID=2933344 RepID=UPI0039170FFA